MSEDILGMNARNLAYIRPYNKKKAIKLADDKLATKELLIKTEIPTPRLFGVINTIKDFEDFDWKKLPANFVIKPNRGFGGEGILILRRSVKKEKFLKQPLKRRKWISSAGEIWDFEHLKSHILDILDGSFSLQGLPDTAFIERKLITHPIFKEYTRKGIPDIRIVVFNKVPVMAMLRLPTEKSRGRANVVQGAIGVGVDIGTGVTTTAVAKVKGHRVVDKHPDSGQELAGLEIPDWDKILEMSVEAQVASGLGYLGVDIAIDKRYGPEILELNARPGLEIQVANLEGLAGRLRRVKGLKVKSMAHGVRIARDLFGGDMARRVEEISGKEVIGIIENIVVFNRKKTRKNQIKAKIDTGAGYTSIDRDLAVKLGFKEAVKYYESFNIKEVLTREEANQLSQAGMEKKLTKHKDIIDTAKIHSSHGTTYRMMIPLNIVLAGREIEAKVSVIPRKELKYPIIIGRQNLKEFLVDPAKKDSEITRKVKKS